MVHKSPQVLVERVFVSGYAIATYVLLVVFLLMSVLLGAALLHFWKKNLSNEKALHTRLVSHYCLLFNN